MTTTNKVQVNVGSLADMGTVRVRHFSEQASKIYGARSIRINPREFDVSSKGDIDIPMGSLEALAGIDAALGDMPDEMDLNFT